MVAKTHGLSGSPAYKRWANIVQRCTNPKHPRYKDYGGRGVGIHESWLDFATFHAAVGDPPTPAHSLDRKKNYRGYVPGNVQWATDLEQASNSRRAVKVRFNGKTQSINEWCREVGLAYCTFKQRRRNGWGLVRAATTPPSTRHQSKEF